MHFINSHTFVCVQQCGKQLHLLHFTSAHFQKPIVHIYTLAHPSTLTAPRTIGEASKHANQGNGEGGKLRSNRERVHIHSYHSIILPLFRHSLRALFSLLCTNQLKVHKLFRFHSPSVQLNFSNLFLFTSVRRIFHPHISPFFSGNYDYECEVRSKMLFNSFVLINQHVFLATSHIPNNSLCTTQWGRGGKRWVSSSANFPANQKQTWAPKPRVKSSTTSETTISWQTANNHGAFKIQSEKDVGKTSVLFTFFFLFFSSSSLLRFWSARDRSVVKSHLRFLWHHVKHNIAIILYESKIRLDVCVCVHCKHMCGSWLL